MFAFSELGTRQRIVDFGAMGERGLGIGTSELGTRKRIVDFGAMGEKGLGIGIASPSEEHCSCRHVFIGRDQSMAESGA